MSDAPKQSTDELRYPQYRDQNLALQQSTDRWSQQTVTCNVLENKQGDTCEEEIDSGITEISTSNNSSVDSSISDINDIKSGTIAHSISRADMYNIQYIATDGPRKNDSEKNVHGDVEQRIQDSLREIYLKRFKSVNPFSLPFIFSIDNNWVPLTLKLDDDSTSTEDYAHLLNKAFAKKENKRKMLFIEGDPAFGKTLLRRLSYEWTQKKSQLSHYDFVLYAEFRELSEQEFSSITELINYNMNGHLDEQDSKIFGNFIDDNNCCKQHQILVLLDGYDESVLEKQCQELSYYLFSTTVPNPLQFDVVLTSRTGYLTELRKQERFVFADVIGFTTELQKLQYITKHYAIESSINTTSVQNLLETNKNLARLSETPLMLTFICLLHRSINDGTEVELYMNIIWWLLDRNQKDNLNHDVPSLFGYQYNASNKFRVIQDCYLHFPQLHSLEKMAMCDVFKSTFTTTDLEQFQLNQIVEQVGLLRKEEKRDASYHITTEFSFLLRTVQESLTFSFPSEEPPENFCWFIFNKRSKMGEGIIQRNTHAFLQMIKSITAVPNKSRKLFFIKKEEDITKIKFCTHLRQDQSGIIIKGTYLNNFPLISDKGLGIPQSEEAIKLLRHNAEQGKANSQNILGFIYQNGLSVTHSNEEAIKWYRKAAQKGDAYAQNSLGSIYQEGRGVQQSDEEAVHWYRKAAEQGNAYAQYNLGLMYDVGRGISQSIEEAIKWYRKAAEQRNVKAQNSLGSMYQEGQGIQQSDEEAVQWFRKAAEQGNTYPQYNLAVMYQEGRDVPQSDEEAAQLYRKAAEQGNVIAQNHLGVMYRNGQGVPQSDEDAVQWYRKAAKQGNAIAQNNVGFMYRYGRGVSQSDEEAVQWYRKAAEQGHATAQNNFGFMCDEGRGVQKSDKEAAHWYRKAAEQGNADAQHNLALMYHVGRGVSQSEEEAFQWYRKAAEQGNAGAQNKLGFVYWNGRGVTQSHEEAVQWFIKAAEQENADAQYGLGVMLQEGQGVLQSDEEAFQWWRKAAEQGDIDAQNSLGFMYAEGQGVPQSNAEALQWFRKAAEQGNAYAQINLGCMYHCKQGVPHFNEKAVEWYAKVAVQGDARAQSNLGVVYQNGNGVPQCYEIAIEWYQKIAEQIFAQVQHSVRLMCNEWCSVPQSNENAAEWLAKATEQSHSKVQFSLGFIYENSKVVPQLLDQLLPFNEIAQLNQVKTNKKQSVKLLQAQLVKFDKYANQKYAKENKPKQDLSKTHAQYQIILLKNQISLQDESLQQVNLLMEGAPIKGTVPQFLHKSWLIFCC